MSNYYITETTSSTKEFAKSFESLLPGSRVYARHPKTGFSSSGDGIISKNFFIGNNLTKYLGEIEIQNSSSCILSKPRAGIYETKVSGENFHEFNKHCGGIILPSERILYKAVTEIVDDLMIIISIEDIKPVLEKNYHLISFDNCYLKQEIERPKFLSLISFIESTLKTARNFPYFRESLLLKTNIKEISILMIAEIIAETLQIPPVTSYLPDLMLVRKAEEIIDDECADIFTILELASKLNSNPRSIQIAFKKHRDYSPMQFLRERKLMKARKLLINHNSSSMSVKTAAIGAGVYDLNRFSKYYKEMFGELPSETLKKMPS